MNRLERLSIVIFLVGIIILSPQFIMAQDMSLEQGLDTIADQISESVTSVKIKNVAVMDFNDLQGNVTLLGRFIEEELVTRLFQANQFKVIERSLLENALGELKFNLSDLVDPSVAKQLGRVV
ncbi:MAG TPA: CsgG/HfaB family protein, partial [Thermodesulfovibrionales bacterium]|nr:CsgG/HfaB family protein [Thermodesulfovibrionales bacterium]